MAFDFSPKKTYSKQARDTNEYIIHGVQNDPRVQKLEERPQSSRGPRISEYLSNSRRGLFISYVLSIVPGFFSPEKKRRFNLTRSDLLLLLSGKISVRPST